eukprot:XP_011676453.1 PREDICTED: alpha-protein kinase 1-like [Strongylocentrotus purpuratus]
MLQMWSETKQQQQRQKQQQQRQKRQQMRMAINYYGRQTLSKLKNYQQQLQCSLRRRYLQHLYQWERPMTSTHQESYFAHLIHLLESAQPSGQFQSDPHRRIQSKPQQVQELPRELGTHHSLHLSSGEASRHSVGQGSGYSSGFSNLDMPSTSGSRSAQSRKGAAPVDGEQIPEHRKRIHRNDDDDGGGKRSGKRRAKTNRQPTSP